MTVTPEFVCMDMQNSELWVTLSYGNPQIPMCSDEGGLSVHVLVSSVHVHCGVLETEPI